MALKRSSGILMPISSLPSPYGIGTLGKEARAFVDFLVKAGQKYWQILPIGPLSYGDSPYQSFSTFAGNPYFVDLDLLVADKLLKKEDIDSIDWGSDPTHVDYGKIYENRFAVLEKAARKGLKRDEAEVAEFAERMEWLEDYALFMALKRKFQMKPWWEWPEDVRLRREAGLRRYREELHKDVELFVYIQFLFFRQWEKLKTYANDKGIEIIGDLPIYVAMDSADVWSGPQWFQLDRENVPTAVSGVPPDDFTADGQLWGNPLYRWDEMERDGYGWWIRRVDGAFQLYDVLRFDHFRGLESYWSVPYGEATAKNGKWVKGPGMGLIGTLRGWFQGKEFIAEDLGYTTPALRDFLEESGFPGMKVLEFAFDPKGESDYLPHRYDKNCVCYTGTHDNNTLAGWAKELPKKEADFVKKYLAIRPTEGLVWGVIRGGCASTANLFVAQMQDYLGIGSEGRVNTPGLPAGNWGWRMAPGAATAELAKKIAELTHLYGR